MDSVTETINQYVSGTANGSSYKKRPLPVSNKTSS